jgi:hypothetical protein
MPWPKPVAPQRVNSQGGWMMALGGKSAKTKRLRSTTPMGFARAVWQYNQPAESATDSAQVKSA